MVDHGDHLSVIKKNKVKSNDYIYSRRDERAWKMLEKKMFFM